MQVKLLDLNRQWESIRDELAPAVMEVFEDSQFVLGGRVAEFEAAVAGYCGVAGGVGVASGTDAILIALRACGVSRGEDVITTPYTFFATAGAIWNVGGRPKFVDIDPDTYNIDPAKIEAALAFTSAVVMPVHLFGQVADMDPILAVAKEHGLRVVEDAAQAIGAAYKGKRAGSFGDLTAFSFFPSKNLGGAGDGGMVVGEDPDLVEKVRVLRTHGATKSYIHEVVGWNSRLDALQAVVLGVKLRHLDEWDRRAHAAVYDAAFGPMEEVTPPKVMEGCTHIYNQYVIRARDRDGLKAFLGEQGIGSAIYYPLPLHLQACFEALGHKEGDFPESERAARETLSLPVYPELREEEQAFVIEKVKEFYAPVKTVLTVVGARPQFVKAAPLSPLIRERFREVLVHTGQHYDRSLSDAIFESLTIPEPDVNLGVGSADHAEQTTRMIGGIRAAIREHRPDLVVAFGDTNSTLAAALAAARAGVPLAHVEAGLRSFRRRMPEEVNRIAADHLAELCLCPTAAAVANLAAEGIRERARLVGDVMLDVCLETRERLGEAALERHGVTPGGFFLATVHRPRNTDRHERLAAILEAFGRLDAPVVFPLHPRTKSSLERAGAALPENIAAVDPLSYPDTLELVAAARAVLTDSGGLQKEAFFLGTPCVTLRAETEWTETVAAGRNVLADADPDRIVAAARAATALEGDPDLSLFGGGRAAPRIVEEITAFLG